MSILKVDLDLVKKYNVPGPRYTSYPPATHFTNEISPEVFVEKLRADNQSSPHGITPSSHSAGSGGFPIPPGQRGLSLYFHLPFCQTLCWFGGCTTGITTDQT